MLGNGRRPRKQGPKVGLVGDVITSAKHLTPMLKNRFWMDETIQSK